MARIVDQVHGGQKAAVGVLRLHWQLDVMTAGIVAGRVEVRRILGLDVASADVAAELPRLEVRLDVAVQNLFVDGEKASLRKSARDVDRAVGFEGLEDLILVEAQVRNAVSAGA